MRIRSIHPGLFADEVFIELSPLSVLLWLGLLCAADDQGIFEWKPGVLKVHIMPGNTRPVQPLLDELKAADRIRQFGHGGRQFGAIRNFRKYQKPKYPKATYFMPPELRDYITDAPSNSESACGELDLFAQSSPTNTQKEGKAARPRENISDNLGNVVRSAQAVSPDPGNRHADGDGAGAGEGEESPSSLRSEGNKNSTEDQDLSLPVDLDRTRAAEVARAWNAMAVLNHLPTITRLTSGRRALAQQRLKDAGGIEGVRAAFVKVARSSFLRGERPGPMHEGWRCDFDFIMTEKHFTRLTEGCYDDRTIPAANGAHEGPPPGFRPRIDPETARRFGVEVEPDDADRSVSKH